MKNIQKITAIGLCITMLASAAALAETADTASSATPQTPNVATAEQQNQLPSDLGSQMPQGMPGMKDQNRGPMNLNGQKPQGMPGMNGQNQGPMNFDSQMPQGMPGMNNQNQGPMNFSGQMPQDMPDMNNQNQTPADFSGEQPALPEDADSDAERPALPDGTAPADQGSQQPPAMPGMDAQNQGGFSQMVVRTGNSGGLRMRREASQDSKILGVYANGTEVDVLEAAEGEWVKVQIGNRTGYMMIKFLEEEAPAADAADLTLTDETAQN